MTVKYKFQLDGVVYSDYGAYLKAKINKQAKLAELEKQKEKFKADAMATISFTDLPTPPPPTAPPTQYASDWQAIYNNWATNIDEVAPPKKKLSAFLKQANVPTTLTVGADPAPVDDIGLVKLPKVKPQEKNTKSLLNECESFVFWCQSNNEEVPELFSRLLDACKDMYYGNGNHDAWNDGYKVGFDDGLTSQTDHD